MKQVAFKNQASRGLRYSILLAAVLFIIQILVSVVFSNLGQTIGGLEERAKILSLENQKLREEIARFEALINVASHASELGFGETQILYLPPLSSQVEMPVAQKVQ